MKNDELIENKFTNKDVANLTYRHLKLVLDKLKDTDLNKFNLISRTFYISDTQLEFCTQSILAIERYFHVFGLNCKMLRYSSHMSAKKEIMLHCYTWKLSKLKKDDLPF